MRSFAYRALDNKRQEIRLLTVHAGSGRDTVRGSIRHVSLSRQRGLDYETVSYCWEDQRLRWYVVVNGRLLDVPASAEKALRRLRHKKRDRVLWIDSICINQKDTRERSQQVGLMCDIYSGSTLNLVWLGEGDDSIPQALMAIDTVLGSMRQETSDMRELVTFIYGKDRSHDCLYSTTGIVGEIDWQPLLDFFARPWFRRLWVLQEAALASSSLCHCGDQTVDLVDILRVALWIMHKGQHTPFGVGANPGIMAATHMHAYVDREYGQFHASIPESGYGFSLGYHLSITTLFRTSDPRDVVFAILGLPRDKLYEAHPPLLVPDYEKPAGLVLRDATRAAIEEYRSLDVMHMLCHREQSATSTAHSDNTTPSWVPAWTRAYDMYEDSNGLAPFFRADGDSACMSYRRVMDRNVLSLGGFQVDVVLDCTPTVRYDHTGDATFIDNFIRYCFGLTNDHFAQDSGPSNIERHIGTTLITGRDVKGEPADVEAYEDLTAFHQHVLAYGEPPFRLEDWRNGDQKPDLSLQKASQYENAFRQAVCNRRFFVTESGRVGMGPQTMARGDEIIVFYGGRRPLVLRPKGEQYEMIGPCYVHGIMFGEAVEKAKAEGREEVWFDTH